MKPHRGLVFAGPAFVLALLAPACGGSKTARPETGAEPAASLPPQQPVSQQPVSPEQLELAALGGIAKLHTLGDVWLASQPSAADLERAKESGVRTVVNLRPAGEQGDFDEESFVTGLGMTYVNLPISGAPDLSDDLLARARELLEQARRPLLVHCASANRVGAVWIPWRVLDGGLELEDAVAEAKVIGLKTPELEAKARDYVARQQAGGQ